MNIKHDPGHSRRVADRHLIAVCGLLWTLFHCNHVQAQQPINNAILCPDCPPNTTNTSGVGYRGDGVRFFKFTTRRRVNFLGTAYELSTRILHAEFDDCDRCNSVGWVHGGNGWQVNPASPIPVTTFSSSTRIHRDPILSAQVYALADTPRVPVLTPAGCWTCGGGKYLGLSKPQLKWVPDHIPPVDILKARSKMVVEGSANKVRIHQLEMVYPPGALSNIYRNKNFELGWSLKPHCRYCANHQGGTLSAMKRTVSQWMAPFLSNNRTNPVLDTKSLSSEHDTSFRIMVIGYRTLGWKEVRPSGISLND